MTILREVLLLLAFALLLVVGVLLSGLAERTVLSTAVLFLLGGFAAALALRADVRGIVGPFSEVALVCVLFTDALRTPVSELRRGWALPGRALAVGMPLTALGTAALAHLVAGLPWLQALLVGAALAPTDPVLSAALIGAEEVPARLRHLLTVESGLNDGLALPLVMILLALLSPQPLPAGRIAAEVALGIGLGVALPYLVVSLEKAPFFGAAASYEPLSAFSVALLVYAVARVAGVNAFLAMFAAGATVATVSPRMVRSFGRFGEIATELTKLAAIFVFGAVLSPRLLAEVPLSGYVFAVLAIVAVRPAALAVALVGGGLGWREWAAAAWFGPKGFSSVVYGLLILSSGIPRGRELAHLVAVVVSGSILAHSSTDVLVARWFRGAAGPARGRQGARA